MDKINEVLIKQVQAGTHCAEFDKKKHKLEDLKTFLKLIAPKDEGDIHGNNGFYGFDAMDEFWYREDYNPTDFPPIPLDDFFKEEEVKYPSAASDYTEWRKSQPATPSQPTLPEELVSKHREVISDPKEYDIFHHNADDLRRFQSLDSAAVTLDYMGRFAEWASDNYTYAGEGIWDGDNDDTYTRSELIDLYFQSNQ